MKDLRECGEVGPSENGEPVFSCLFCGNRLGAMELIIDHINRVHKDKITFEPEALKKRPRRKRKSELPVSEWIHLEKEKKRRPGRISRKKLLIEESFISDNNIEKQDYEEKENSEPICESISRITVENNDFINSEEKELNIRPRRKIAQIKNNTEDTYTDLIKKEARVKRRGRKKRLKSSVAAIEPKEIPIKIRFKKKDEKLIIVKEENETKSIDELNNIEEDIKQCTLENIKLQGTVELSEQKTEITNQNCLDSKKNLKEEFKEEFIEENPTILYESFPTEIKIDNNLKIEEHLHNFQNIVKNEENYFSDNSDSDDENTDTSVNNSYNDNFCSDNENINYFKDEFEGSSSSDSETEKISELREKLRKKNIQVTKTTFETDMQNNTVEVSNMKNVEVNKIENKNLKPILKKRKVKCTPKTRKMNEFGEYVCDLCGNTYKKATSLSRHRADCREGKTITPRVRIRKLNGLFPCTYENCKAEFKNVEEVFKHEKEVHGKKKYARPQTRRKNEFGEYVCDICGNIYKKGTSLSRHRALCREGIVVVPKKTKRIRLRNEDGMFQCAFNLCGSKFSKIEDVILHEKKKHKGIKNNKIGRMCEICGKWLTSACSFKSHMLRHSGERNYKCDQCSAAFYDKYALTLHKKVHTDLKEYECEYCHKKFTRAPEMRKHIRYIHLNMRPDPVMCDLCGKYFHWKFDLKSHMRRHYNVKTIRCEFAECEQMFANRSDLKKHLITHNPDIKPWQCEICSNSFSRKSTLVKHQKLHTGTKDYSCSICGKAFAQSPGLYMHMKSHGFNLKPEGAGRYERVSHIAYRQMDSDRISNLNFKQNNEINSVNRNNIENNIENKNENDSINEQDNNHFQELDCNKYIHGDEESKDSLNQKLIDHHQKNEIPLEIPSNQITTIRIESIQGMNINPTITTIDNEIQINLGRSLQIGLGQISQPQNN